MLPDAYCRSLASSGGDIGQAARESLAGDHLARLAVSDWLEEQGEDMRGPFEVGKSYLICTVTLYYVGRVVESDRGSTLSFGRV